MVYISTQLLDGTSRCESDPRSPKAAKVHLGVDEFRRSQAYYAVSDLPKAQCEAVRLPHSLLHQLIVRTSKLM